MSMYLVVAASANIEEEKEEHWLEVLFGENNAFPLFPIISLQIQTLGLFANYHNSEADLGQRVIKEFVFV